jgi:predicted O-methyltransferase YrrM
MITPTKEFWEVFKNTDGALSCTEAVAIMNLAAQAPQGIYVELGSFKGKSALAASQSLKEGHFYLVEPEFINKEWCGDVINKIFRNSVNNISPKSVPDYSVNVIGNMYAVKEPYSFVFVDSGSHQDGLPMQEVKLLEDKMVEGGIIAFHDWNSQFKEVKEASDYLVSTGKYEYVPVNWDEIIVYVNENNLEEGNKSWHHTELKNPCFVGAVKRK